MEDPPILTGGDPTPEEVFRPADSLHSLASDLRELRHSAGNPTLRALTTATGLSKSVLSSALTGGRLPTGKTLERLVRSFGQDPGSWMDRREAIRHQASSSLAAPANDDASPIRRRLRPRPGRISVAALACAVAGVLLLTTAGTTMMGRLLPGDATSQQIETPGQPSDFIAPAQGVDPLRTTCIDDAAVAISSPRYGDSVLVEIVSSGTCNTVWARASWLGDAPSSTTLSIELYREGAKYEGRARTSPSVPVTAHTTMLTIRDEKASYCSIVSLTLSDGARTDLGPPVCASALVTLPDETLSALEKL